MAQSQAMLRYAGRLSNHYPAARALEIDEGCGLVSDLERVWRPPVGLGLEPTTYGHPIDFNGTPEHSAMVKGLREKVVADCQLLPTLNRLASGGVNHVPADCLQPTSYSWI
jgi:hypothetical protein